MTFRASPIPLLPVGQAQANPVLHHNLAVIERFGALFREVLLREPPAADPARWREHVVDGVRHRFAQPLTLTPYAAVRPCSARCRFCSETLRDVGDSGRMAAALRPGAGYFAQLRAALAQLHGLPLAYSLSGLESTDDPDWLLELLATLKEAPFGPLVEEAVMYSNGAGLVAHGERLLPALAAFGLSAIEWSRHHDQAGANQRLMRFRDGQPVADGAAFRQAVERVNAAIPVRLVCVVQQGGIAKPADVLRYLDWAHGMGVGTVIFREFSELPASYRANPARRYIDGARVAVETLLHGCMADRGFRDRYQPQLLTSGYYFWNARWATAGGQEVVFEKSSYVTLREHEASGAVYKLVFHANGHLCAGWQPDRHILWRPDGRQ